MKCISKPLAEKCFNALGKDEDLIFVFFSLPMTFIIAVGFLDQDQQPTAPFNTFFVKTMLKVPDVGAMELREFVGEVTRKHFLISLTLLLSYAHAHTHTHTHT